MKVGWTLVGLGIALAVAFVIALLDCFFFIFEPEFAPYAPYVDVIYPPSLILELAAMFIGAGLLLFFGIRRIKHKA